MRSFYATTCQTDCLQIPYKFCKNWISVPNIVHQLTLSLHCNHWKIQNSGDFQDAINSIRRPANERSEANDVSLLWRHSSWSHSWWLKRAYRRPFMTVFGEFEPKMFWTPKRHFLTSQRVFWAIVHEIPCTGYFSRRVQGKNKNKKERPYISRISPGSALTADWHKFRVTCSSRGRNQLCKVLSQSVKGFGFCEGSKSDHSHRIATSPLTMLGTDVPAVIN